MDDLLLELADHPVDEWLTLCGRLWSKQSSVPIGLDTLCKGKEFVLIKELEEQEELGEEDTEESEYSEDGEPG